MSDVKRIQETLFDIPIFSWKEWDMIDTDTLQFYNVELQFESMKQYNGCDCSLDFNGKLTITKVWEKVNNYIYETEIVWEGFVCQIPEFMEELNKKYKGWYYGKDAYSKWYTRTFTYM